MREILPAGLLLFVLAGCAAPAPAPSDAETLHALQSRGVNVLMSRMSTLVFERKLTDTQVAERRTAMAKKLAIDTNALANALVSVDAEGQFTPFTETLRAEADEIAGRASYMSPAEMDASIERIRDTCKRCHSAYLTPLQQP